MIVTNKMENGFVVFVHGEESTTNFKNLIQRGANLWPDAPPELKVLADQITNDWSGNVPLQDYVKQDTSKPLGSTVRRVAAPCSLCGTDNLLDISPGDLPKTFACWHCKSSSVFSLLP
jgi:hypothetical protein